MADSVSFKAYLKRDGQEVEVRRFAIDAGAAGNFLYLRGKIQAMFPSLTTDTFVVYWQDQDGDYITLSSDEELLEALSAGSPHPQPFKLYVHTQQANNSAGEGQSDNLHSGVVCDACDGEVRGFRYKCVTCADYDLCSQCERAGHHAEHFMLRMPHMPRTPAAHLSHPKLFHKLMKRQHKFHKHHGWNRSHERESRGQESAGRCSFSRPACPAADMFDFSALLDFLNTLGVASTTAQTGASTTAQTGASSSAQTASTQATSAQTNSAQTNSAQATSAQANSHEAAMRARARDQFAFIRKSLGLEDEPAGNSQPNNSSDPRPQDAAPRADNYLNGIGQAITALLDPFGVDVTFDVRSKSSGQPTPMPASGSPPSTSTAAPATTSAPTPTTTNPTAVGTNTAPATTAAAIYPELPTPPSQSPSTARRNSDDWTLLNRESPVRGEVAMDVDREAPHPQDHTEAASAPPPNPQPVDVEKKRIDDCLEKLRAMGFDLGPETQTLRDLLTRENCDIASVLDMLLNNARK